MAKLISVSIDLTKIDRTRIKLGKNGQKYYDILISVNDEKDKYDNDCSVQQGQTKEERESKADKVYLGNGKTIWTNEIADGQPTKQDIPAQSVVSKLVSDVDDDLPF